MAKCPYNSSSEYCEIEVQLEVAKVAENEATETFHEMDAEIRRLLQRIELLEKTLQQYNSKRSIITHQGQKKKHLGQEVQKIR